MSDRGRDYGPLPKLYSIFRGEVASLQPYGAFVKIPHTRKNGLVHKTQISKMKIDNPSDVLTVGDMVYCKVISLGEAGEEKISLSMKVVNQDSGKDLDENLIITKQEELRRKKGLPPVQDKIELGAVLNTTCKKCGMKGHLTQDCFKLPGDKLYDLIPELDLETLHQPPVHREKKEKKKKIEYEYRLLQQNNWYQPYLNIQFGIIMMNSLKTATVGIADTNCPFSFVVSFAEQTQEKEEKHNIEFRRGYFQ
ncbi:Nucleolar protein of 40 kDa [Holothuria leucospilota]|uniref:Nucleolar protein of 40 kDa n=1 Tax=Holothuria leucospilota TaxID=206669 RepID=A0A9Q1CTG3_HOLLE|nr:Nucleolar protein of 40 kDa [Holothuria leucospilota]